MSVRGIRGATTISEDTPESILLATRELLLAILEANHSLRSQEIASVLFTVTDDLRAAYPALAAREIGWEEVPLMCAQEIPVRGGLEKCIRVLIFWNTNIPQSEVRHVYLKEAARLRPDLVRAGL
jgi:chorismate mutase